MNEKGDVFDAEDPNHTVPMWDKKIRETLQNQQPLGQK